MNRFYRKPVLILAFVSVGFISFSQNQKVADSLIRIYNESNLTGEARLKVLDDIAANHTNYQEKIKYANLLIEAATSSGSDYWLYKGYLELGSAYRLQGDLSQALDSYLKCLEAAKRAHCNECIGGGDASIADIYSLNGDRENAKKYFTQAVLKLSETNDSLNYGAVILNAGEEYFRGDDLDSAYLYYQMAKKIFEKLNFSRGLAYAQGNCGMVQTRLGDYEIAEKNLNEAIASLENFKDFYPICDYLTYLADIYYERENIQAALKYAQRSLDLARQYGLKEQIGNADLKLSQLYEALGDDSKSLEYYKEHVIYRDSVNNINAVQKMANMRTEYEVSQKQVEVNLLNQQKRNQKIILFASIISSALVILLAFVLYRRYNFIKKTNIIIEEEKNRSDNLLLNILPEETALELKRNGEVQAKKFESVTVLFADFAGFTKIAEKVSPEHLVKSIDIYFREFDKITARYGLEKIKTIGDAYMCAGGLSGANVTHVKNVILAAKDMIAVVKTKIDGRDDLIHFDIRVGVHTGPVVAGIVGLRKWQYDIWGDTVNIASRMQSMSEPNRINISETTYQEIKDDCQCEYRGIMDVKNHGLLKMYFLT